MFAGIQGSNKLTKYLYILYWIQVFTRFVLPGLDTFFQLKDFRIVSFFLPVLSHRTIQPLDLEDFELESDVITLCCPGGGFAGFWFTLGRLFDMEKRGSIDLLSSEVPGFGRGVLEDVRENVTLFDLELGTHNQETMREIKKPVHYHCFSAGCLGVVSILQNYTFDNVFDMALASRLRWKKGVISRYQVVEDFIDQILNIPTIESPRNETFEHKTRITSGALSRIHVITTRLNFRLLNTFEPVLTNPSNLSELKTLLLQTSFIPYVTGDGFWYKNNQSLQDKHLDGAFSSSQHDKCQSHLSLPFESKLLWNTLNIDLLREDAQLLWQMGLNFDNPGESS